MIHLRKTLIIFITLMFIFAGCSSSPQSTKTDTSTPNVPKLGIKVHPYAVDYTKLSKFGKRTSLSAYNPSISWSVDVRSSDLTSLDLTNRLNDLIYACFDSKTTWPEKLPAKFKPDTVLEINKNPGLGIHKLHTENVTGKNVSVAIIDQSILVDHVEYKDRLKMYEEINVHDPRAQMHGPAVASILAGKTTGVAPDANLYFVACENYNRNNQDLDLDYTWVAQSIDRIVEVNKALPKVQKIRVISISASWAPNIKGYKEITDSVKRAVDNGIFVVSCNLFETYKDKFYFHGLSMDNLSNKDDINSYKVYEWPAWMRMVAHIKGFGEYYEQNIDKDMPKEILLLPLDCKTTASPTGDNDYVFYKDGGWSWGIPYVAGLYALCCQVNPDVTPQLFWKTALSTGDERTITKGTTKFAGKIVNPERLINAIKK